MPNCGPAGPQARGGGGHGPAVPATSWSDECCPLELADQIASSQIAGSGVDAAEEAKATARKVARSEGPWGCGRGQRLGKRVPVNQFRLPTARRTGLRAIKFRRSGDELVGLKVLAPGGVVADQ